MISTLGDPMEILSWQASCRKHQHFRIKVPQAKAKTLSSPLAGISCTKGQAPNQTAQ